MDTFDVTQNSSNFFIAIHYNEIWKCIGECNCIFVLSLNNIESNLIIFSFQACTVYTKLMSFLFIAWILFFHFKLENIARNNWFKINTIIFQTELNLPLMFSNKKHFVSNRSSSIVFQVLLNTQKWRHTVSVIIVHYIPP